MTALRDWAATVRIPLPVPDAPSPESAGDTARKVGAERQRIALALHDEVAPLLFAMAARVRRAIEDHPDPAEPHDEPMLATLRTLARELATTQDQLRRVIHACAPVEPAEAVPAATQRDVEAFTERTGVPAHLVVRGRPSKLSPSVERVALNCLRQALVNVEQHAEATIAVVTLDYREDRLCLVVQDDGLGLPAGFEPGAIPVDGHHWGFTSMAEQVERLGGSVLLRGADEGGTQLRVELPVPR